jgi:hypothetical protein
MNFMPYKKTKGTPWSPRYLGYQATLEGSRFIIVAKNKSVLRKIHKALFPSFHFNPELVHPANVRRTGDTKP